MSNRLVDGIVIIHGMLLAITSRYILPSCFGLAEAASIRG